MAFARGKDKRDVSIEVGPEWTVITVKVPTHQIAALGVGRLHPEVYDELKKRNRRKKKKAAATP